MAARVGATGEDDGDPLTSTTDMNADASYCRIFDAAWVGDGPGCKLALPDGFPAVHSHVGTRLTVAALAHRRLPRRRDRAVGDVGLRRGDADDAGRRWHERCRPNPRAARRRVDAADRPAGAAGGQPGTASSFQRLPISNTVLTNRLLMLTTRRTAGSQRRTEPGPFAPSIGSASADGPFGRCCCRSGSGNDAGCPSMCTGCRGCIIRCAAATSRRC